ncbi:hypothetical protein [Phenylobacterium sp.]|uniref:hypothetical protein n=1 Tax=Phenylobacterium sp. TaxID=1871053 RepID=UPI002732FD5B|nr:hypothetical protein [Phenylobacterium sp.]MDP3175780.1 hypothetical protein [Phenylobacterium sp.]MDP3658605.1 hypothetical protein [Phenylobacterium sp.]
MNGSTRFAYSLAQAEDGWTWSVYDEDGETVASGMDPDRQACEAAVNARLASSEFS